MIKQLKLLAMMGLVTVISSMAFAFIAVFPISGLVPATGEVISGRYVVGDEFRNPEAISLRVGGQICTGLLHHKDDSFFSGHFTCEDGRRAAFEAHINGFFALKPNSGRRPAAQYSLLGRGHIDGQPFTIEFNTVLPIPFVLPDG
jgi:hypothetical protein